MRFARSLVFATIASVPALASALQPGDVAVIGIYSDAPDKTAFVALVDLPAGTTLGITDEGWKSTGGFRSGENHVSWTAPTGGVAAGSVINFNMSDVSNSGDQITVYSGSAASPTPLFAVNDDGSSWASNASSNNNSALPAGLSNGATAVALNEKDNYAYTGPTSGTKAVLLAAIANKANWTGNDGSAPAWPSAFTVTGGGTPTPPGVPGTATYNTTSDGSAAVWAGDHFINFNDETNVVRLYKAGTSGTSVKTWDLGSGLGLSKEADFEDAARIGNDLLVITSHGRNKDGEYKADRYRFARLAISGSGATTGLTVTGYTKTLLENLLDSSKWQQPDTAVINLLKDRTKLGTATVPNLAPKIDGFNIEGLAQLPGATPRVAIGLRNPLINNLAIVVTLENPLQAATGSTPVFGQAIRLDLGGYGIRGMVWSATDNKMYIVAGHISSDPEAQFFLYSWDGLPTSAPQYLGTVQHSSGGSIEALLPHEGTQSLRMLVDEGGVLVNGTEKKDLSASQQNFHDMLFTLP
ncbi:DUF3616 domain-containing protein [Solimonas sp. K1W22B-7]|uniref:DUF3616 domain-containing protein n=1 Tax=Solimonas sp. K1W22B-7 TaxID=2303331 RepID=UPI000E33417F|nr:DUF3616 domain-containing protein [Solimonas sp. K1W22B-7]AXQ29503.1 DUF3616 domain-containing protein [Solimonas sp. K1W22B-7]